MEIFNLGQKIRINAAFADAAGDPFDPSGGVFVVIKAPRMASVTYEYPADPEEVVKDGTGSYHIDQSLALSGLWVVRVYSEGDLEVGSADQRFRVRETVTDA